MKLYITLQRTNLTVQCTSDNLRIGTLDSIYSHPRLPK